MIRRNVEPDYEATLALVRSMSDESLKDIVNNDEKVDEIVKSSEQCTALETEKDIIMAENKSIAEYNLSLSPKLESGKAKLKELCDSVQAVRESILEKQSQLSNHSGNLNSETVLALLQTAAVESEEESEKIADKFYQKEIEMEEFLHQFQSFRKMMHLRRVKADKMNDIINKKQDSKLGKRPESSVPYPIASLPYPTASLPYPSASVPYPVGGMNMPYFPMANNM